MSDLTTLAIQVLFGILFLWAVWVAIRDRDALARDVALVIAPIAFLLAMGVIGDLVTLPPWFGLVTTVFLLAQPVFSLKLVSDIRGLPSWLLPGAVLAVVLASVAIVLTSGAITAVLAGIGVFVITEVVAAAYLAGEARKRSGAARIRLVIAAVATGAVAASLLTIGASAAGPDAAAAFGVVASSHGPARGRRLLGRLPAAARPPAVLAEHGRLRAQRTAPGRRARNPELRTVGRAGDDRRPAHRCGDGDRPSGTMTASGSWRARTTRSRVGTFVSREARRASTKGDPFGPAMGDLLARTGRGSGRSCRSPRSTH